MAYSDRISAMLRAELGPLSGLVEKPMFGSWAFMRHGHMVCCAREETALVRPGKEREAQALALPGVGPFVMGKRSMGGVVLVSMETITDAGHRRALLDLALEFVATLPPK
ncbi:MAG: TfoX/Sxy family protein [Pseudomonadota bacterium]